MAHIVPPTDATLQRIVAPGYISNPVLKREDFEDDENCPRKVGNNIKYFGARRRAWTETQDLFDELDLACNWDWFSTGNFERKSADWHSKLKDLEVKYKGKLSKPYSVDRKIRDVSEKLLLYSNNYEWQQKSKLYNLPGVLECSELSDLLTRLASFATIDPRLKPSIRNVAAKSEKIQREL